MRQVGWIAGVNLKNNITWRLICVGVFVTSGVMHYAYSVCKKIKNIHSLLVIKVHCFQ